MAKSLILCLFSEQSPMIFLFFLIPCCCHSFPSDLIFLYNICAIIVTYASNSFLRELKQTRRRRQRERHLKMKLHVSAIISQLFKVIMLEKCVLTILELNWNQRFRGKEIKLNICHHILTSSTQLQSRSFHVVERTRTSSKCPKLKNARAKRAEILFFIVRYANL